MKPEHNSFCKDFWGMWTAKLLRTFLSVKVWTIVAITWIATWLLTKSLINGTQWTTVVISGIVAIVLARSVFQVASLKNGHNEKKE
jgi:hypothetical protein